MYRDAFRLLVLRWDLDKIAERNGWQFHTDGIHLNGRGGKILARLAQEFVVAREMPIGRVPGWDRMLRPSVTRSNSRGS
jgi:hypothetical protein